MREGARIATWRVGTATDGDGDPNAPVVQLVELNGHRLGRAGTVSVPAQCQPRARPVSAQCPIHISHLYAFRRMEPYHHFFKAKTDPAEHPKFSYRQNHPDGHSHDLPLRSRCSLCSLLYLTRASKLVVGRHVDSHYGMVGTSQAGKKSLVPSGK